MKFTSILISVFAALVCSSFAFSQTHSGSSPEDLIRFSSKAQAEALRRRAVGFLWGSSFLPGREPVHVRCDEIFSGLKNLKRIEKMRLEMDFGLDSLIYCFFPVRSNNRLLLYHHGHAPDKENARSVTEFFLANGFTVVDFQMPLFVRNSCPEISFERLGTLRIQEHWFMKFLLPGKGHALKYFIEPVVAAINYFERYYNFDDISVLGISSGAWTTTVAAALDTRIDTSFSLNDPYPIYIQADSPDWSGWEQTVPEFCKTINYLELYALGTVGPGGRRHVQIMNSYCNQLRGWEYKAAVIRAASAAGAGSGAYDFWSYEFAREHVIPQFVLGRILAFLRERKMVKE